MIRCKEFDCKHNKSGACYRQSISLDESRTCISYEKNDGIIRGEWIEKWIDEHGYIGPRHYACSQCDYRSQTRLHYCPNCKAEMANGIITEE